eukprot:28317-Rhodomonas_salina.6
MPPRDQLSPVQPGSTTTDRQYQVHGAVCTGSSLPKSEKTAPLNSDLSHLTSDQNLAFRYKALSYCVRTPKAGSVCAGTEPHAW